MASTGVFELLAGTALASADVVPFIDVSDSTQAPQGSLLKITMANFFATVPSAVNITSATATAFCVGRLGGTSTPAFTVDASTALQVAGLKVVGAVTTGTVAVVVTDSGAVNTNLTINALGSGTIGIGSVSTGRVTITPVTTITGAVTHSSTLTQTGALTYGGVTLSNAVTGTGNMVLSASPTLTGTVVLTGTTITGTPTWSSSQAITLSTAAQPNVTSVGTLTSLNLGGALVSTSSITVGAASQIEWNGRSRMVSGTDGVVTMTNAAGTAFTQINWGGTSASFPSWRRNRVKLEAIVADGSAWAALEIGGLVVNGTISGLTVSSGTTAVQALTATSVTMTGRLQMNNAQALSGKINAGTVRDLLQTTSGDVIIIGDSASWTSIDFYPGSSANKMSLATSGALSVAAGISATTGTFTGKISTTVTTEQQRLNYDSTHYIKTTVDSSGNATRDVIGAGGIGHVFSVNGSIVVQYTDSGFNSSVVMITTASASGSAGLRLPHGSAPSSPVNGDMWTTTSGLFVRINGATVGPLS